MKHDCLTGYQRGRFVLPNVARAKAHHEWGRVVTMSAADAVEARFRGGTAAERGSLDLPEWLQFPPRLDQNAVFSPAISTMNEWPRLFDDH
jgi:hypothetical protein